MFAKWEEFETQNVRIPCLFQFSYLKLLCFGICVYSYLWIDQFYILHTSQHNWAEYKEHLCAIRDDELSPQGITVMRESTEFKLSAAVNRWQNTMIYFVPCL